MYKLTYDAHTLHDPADGSAVVRDPTFDLVVNGVDIAEFVVNKANPASAYLERMAGTVVLTQGSDVLFRGRILDTISDWDESVTVTCEGLLGSLHDSVIEPFNFPADWAEDPAYLAAKTSGNVVEFLLGELLARHNAQVNADRRVLLGTVTVADSANNISRESTDYTDTWSAITAALTDTTLGGYLVARYTATATYLDYFSSLPTAAQPEIRWDENLLDYSEEIDASELYTVILPIGADGLTINELPDGTISTDFVKAGKLISYTPAVNAYGKITRMVSFDDVSDAAELRSKAVAELGGVGRKVRRALTIQAADLSYQTGSAGCFRVGTSVRTVSAPHSLDAVFPLVELSLDIVDPANTSITLNAEQLTSAELSSARQAERKAAENRLQIEINKAVGRTLQLEERTVEQLTALEQDTAQIRLEAQQNVEEIYSVTDSLGERVTKNTTDLAALTVEAGSIRASVQSIQSDGVTQVRTANGMTFDSQGLHIDRDNADTETLIDETGMVVKDTNTAQEILRADVNGVNALNLTSRQYLIIGRHARFQDYGTNLSGTACFWVEDGGVL